MNFLQYLILRWKFFCCKTNLEVIRLWTKEMLRPINKEFEDNLARKALKDSFTSEQIEKIIKGDFFNEISEKTYHH